MFIGFLVRSGLGEKGESAGGRADDFAPDLSNLSDSCGFSALGVVAQFAHCKPSIENRANIAPGNPVGIEESLSFSEEGFIGE